MEPRTPERRAMLLAVALSKRGYPAPNPHVGCVIVRDGLVVGEGFHDHAGGAHAEVVALEGAASMARKADVYVTLEPCNHHGRTPPCTEALIRAGVRRVFLAVGDPNPKASGGAQRLREGGVEVQEGLCAREASEANRVFLTAMKVGRPYVTVKAAVTLDGFIARSDGTSKWITGDLARRAGQELRAEMGAVLVGRRTVVCDDPQLTARLPGVVNQPVRVVLDPSGRLTGEERVFQQPGSTIRVVGPDVSFRAGDAVCELQDGAFSPSDVLSLLWARGVTGVLVEGGAQTIASFVKSETVDRIVLFVSPKLFGVGVRWLDLGGRGPSDAGKLAAHEPQVNGFRLAQLKRLGGDAMLVFLRAKTKGQAHS